MSYIFFQFFFFRWNFACQRIHGNQRSCQDPGSSKNGKLKYQLSCFPTLLFRDAMLLAHFFLTRQCRPTMGRFALVSTVIQLCMFSQEPLRTPPFRTLHKGMGCLSFSSNLWTFLLFATKKYYSFENRNSELRSSVTYVRIS